MHLRTKKNLWWNDKKIDENIFICRLARVKIDKVLFFLVTTAVFHVKCEKEWNIVLHAIYQLSCKIYDVYFITKWRLPTSPEHFQFSSQQRFWWITMIHDHAFMLQAKICFIKEITYTSECEAKKWKKRRIMVSCNDILIHTIFTHSK